MIDTGASVSILSERYYKRLLKCKSKLEVISSNEKLGDLVSANNSSMPIIAKVQADIKLGGISMQGNFSVITNLVHDVLIGTDILSEAQAVIDLRTNSLVLYDGLSVIPMTQTGTHPVVRTTQTVTIPAYSEAIFMVSCRQRPPKGDYIIEGNSMVPCKSLLVARSLVNVDKAAYPCRVINPTERVVKMKPKTVVGTLSSVKVDFLTQAKNSQPKRSTKTIAEKCKELESKSITFEGTALKGKDLEELICLLHENIDLFATSIAELPGCNILKHRIETGDNPPVQQRSFRHSPEERKEISRQCQEMFQAGIIVPSDTPYSSPVLLVTKKSGEKRFCIDYRSLNAQTSMVAWPLPVFEDILDAVSEQQPTLWSSVDLRSGYWQAELDDSTAHKTGFKTHEGNWCFKRLAMGLTGAVQSFQMLMQKVLSGLSPTSVLIYLDDVLVLGKTAADMLFKLKQVFERFRQAKLRMHPAKCHWSVDRVQFLGHVLDKDGVHVDENKIKIVKEFPVPTTPKRVKSFLGLANYYRRFVKNFSQVSSPMRKLLLKDAKFVWTKECQHAFETLKNALITAPVLALPNFKKGFILTTDASTTGISYVLSQRDDEGRERVCCYGGRGLRSNESRWSITELEGLAIIEGVKVYHTYLAGKPFEIFTDHISLTYLQKMKLSGNNRLTRWALFLQGYRFSVNYKKGALLTAADALSRIPWEVQEKEEPTPMTKTDESTLERMIIDFPSKPDNVIAGVREHHNNIPTLQEISKEIRNCSDFACMYEYLLTGKLPENDELARKLVLESQDFVLDNDVLYHLYTPRTRRLDRAMSVVRQVCIPTEFRSCIAEALHNDNAHIGFDRLYSTVRTRFFWPGMYTFLREFVLTCLDCQRCKRPIHPNQTPMGALPVTKPCSRWFMDFHGPFPEVEGKRYILVLICGTSGWPEVIATKDTKAETVVSAIFDNIVTRFGVPRNLTLQSDNGSGFIAQLSRLFCKTFGIKQYFTSPYNAQANSRVESWADTIHKSLRTMCDEQTDWVKHLQSVAWAYRGSATTSSKLSPFEVIFGRTMDMPIDVAIGIPELPINSVEAFSKEIGPKLEILHRIAQQNVSDNAARYRNKKNEGASLPQFEPGDKVLLYDPTTRTGENAKLKVRYKGPYLVTETRPGYTYKLQLLSNGKDVKRAVHARRLRLLKERDNDLQVNAKQNEVIYQGKMQGKLEIMISLHDVMEIDVGSLICFVDEQLSPIGEVSRRVIKSHGEGVLLPLATMDREARPCVFECVANDSIKAEKLSVVILKKTELLQSNALKNVLNTAIRLVGTATVAIPFSDLIDADHNTWAIAQDCIEVLRDCLQVDHMPISVDFCCESLVHADIMTIVCKELVNDLSKTVEHKNVATEVAQDDSNDCVVQADTADQWYAVKKVLKRRKKKGRVQYLVEWETTGSQSWVDRSDLSDAAVQHFVATHKPKRRTRRN